MGTNFIDQTTNFIKISNSSKILLIRNDRIGDLLVSSPFIKTLRNKYPNTNIDILLSDKNITAIRACQPYINNYYIYTKQISKIIQLISRLRRQHYDLVIDLLDNPSTTNAIILRLIKPTNTLGFRKNKTNKYSIEVPLPNKLNIHIVDRINQLLMPFGIEPSQLNQKLEFHLNQYEKDQATNLLGSKTQQFRFGINISGSNISKFWGIDNYSQLIKYINQEYPNFEIILFYTNSYQQYIDQIPTELIYLKAPHTDNFNVYAAMIAECDILLSPDTSAVHLATAFDIPCIALYTYSGTAETGMPWTPYKTYSKTILTYTDNMSNINIQEIIKSFNEVINELNLK